ncbi:MAG: type I glutamate--ammonia ligase [Melioribacteraceae bacterium]|nr:type I glutamate--ammonia ligase [Melioribacteraceae bacterium]MCO6472535.1 type I glutamate--ammonia ligase [Melioribacteraceae bacterium]MDD3557664.1 type I glutamate--ammonia ligase [Melioribacteraceae bacterium]
MPDTKLQKVNNLIKRHKIEIIDLKCIDLTGRLHHISLPVKEGIMKKLIDEGVGFDGSSYGFKKVENSDMILLPDLESAVLDPFREAPTLSFYTHIVLTDGKHSPFAQDGRFLAKKVNSLLKEKTGATHSWWGPEFEFYIFSNVEYDTRTSTSFYKVDHDEEFYKRAYHAVNPFDIYDDFRDEACRYFKMFGIDVKYHHHEVGERGQQEIETYFSELLKTADNIITAKYILYNLAQERDLFITLMPKPMYQQAGNGMHLHMFLTKNGKNAFYKKGEYGNINELGRYFIGGLLKHGPALSAFTNPSTNSYKRLVPGYEAPVAMTYGQGNRASAIRIPKYISNPDETRFEYRPPDATANPYLCLTAMLLAGIDGVVNKIDPVKEGFGPFDKNIFSEEIVDKIHFLPRNLTEALDALEADNDFLKRGDIFTDELLQQWVNVKSEEVKAIGTMPHPFEYKMYFTL